MVIYHLIMWYVYEIKEQTIENSSYITFLLMLLYKTTANIKAPYNTKMSW